MSLDRKLGSWVEAGLINPAQAASILAFEKDEKRPILMWAIAGLGLLALVLGILLLISSNWDRIPDWFKLASHLTLMAGVAAGIFWANQTHQKRLGEGLLFVFSGLILGGIALQSQIYQLTGDSWQALLMWLAIAGPAMLVAGKTRLTGLTFAGMALLGPIIMAVDTIDEGWKWLLVQGIVMAIPAMLLILALVRNKEKDTASRGFDISLREAGIVATLAGASIAHFAWASHITSPQAMDNLVRLMPVALIAAAALLAAHKYAPAQARPLWWPILIGPVAATAAALAIPHEDVLISRLLGVVLFMGMWGWVAWGAAQVGLSSLFAVAIAAIAVRIFVVYIELFGSLAATGIGLVISGLLLVALAWGWQKIVQKRQALA